MLVRLRCILPTSGSPQLSPASSAFLSNSCWCRVIGLVARVTPSPPETCEVSAPHKVCQPCSTLLSLSLLSLVLYECIWLTAKITLCMARYTHVLNVGMNMCCYLFNSRRAQELSSWVAEWEIESHSSAWTTNLFFLNSHPLNPVLVLKDILISWEENHFLSLQGLVLNSSLTWVISFQWIQAFSR